MQEGSGRSPTERLPERQSLRRDGGSGIDHENREAVAARGCLESNADRPASGPRRFSGNGRVHPRALVEFHDRDHRVRRTGGVRRAGHPPPAHDGAAAGGGDTFEIVAPACRAPGDRWCEEPATASAPTDHERRLRAFRVNITAVPDVFEIPRVHYCPRCDGADWLDSRVWYRAPGRAGRTARGIPVSEDCPVGAVRFRGMDRSVGVTEAIVDRWGDPPVCDRRERV